MKKSITEENEQVLIEFIKLKLYEKSGGMKFSELYADVCEKFSGTRIDPEQTLALIKSGKVPNVCCLTYSWHMSFDLAREKYFIYTP
jgi:hypothetical protein